MCEPDYRLDKCSHIKDIGNTVADVISCLEYDPSVNVKSVHWLERWCYFAILLAHYDPRNFLRCCVNEVN